MCIASDAKEDKWYSRIMWVLIDDQGKLILQSHNALMTMDVCISNHSSILYVVLKGKENKSFNYIMFAA